MKRVPTLAVLVPCFVWGCSGTHPRLDAEAGLPDAGVTRDSGTLLDAGRDAGRDDAGEPPRCAVHADCDDRLLCNGIEECLAWRCVAGPPFGCADGVDCTEDRCEESVGGCVSIPRHTACAEGEVCDRATGCAARPCTAPGECNDGFACNGMETCVSGWCDAGAEVICSLTTSCAAPICLEPAGICDSRLWDADGDGHVSVACGGDDCDDSDPQRRPDIDELCIGGVDEDCDDDRDCDDADCVRALPCERPPCQAVEACDNGVDDTCDGMTDCADPQCVEHPICPGACPEGELALIGTSPSPELLATTWGAGDHTSGSCGGAGSLDYAAPFTATIESNYEFQIYATFDAVIYLLDAAPGCAGAELPRACADNDIGTRLPRLVVHLRAGQRVIVVVDGAGPAEAGAFDLNSAWITRGERACEDSLDNDRDDLTDCADPDCALAPWC